MSRLRKYTFHCEYEGTEMKRYPHPPYAELIPKTETLTTWGYDRNKKEALHNFYNDKGVRRFINEYKLRIVKVAIHNERQGFSIIPFIKMFYYKNFKRAKNLSSC